MSPAASLASTPTLHIEGGVATITLNRPAQRNRLENADLKALLVHFDTVNKDAAGAGAGADGQHGWPAQAGVLRRLRHWRL